MNRTKAIVGIAVIILLGAEDFFSGTDIRKRAARETPMSKRFLRTLYLDSFFRMRTEIP